MIGTHTQQYRQVFSQDIQVFKFSDRFFKDLSSTSFFPPISFWNSWPFVSLTSVCLFILSPELLWDALGCVNLLLLMQLRRYNFTKVNYSSFACFFIMQNCGDMPYLLLPTLYFSSSILTYSFSFFILILMMYLKEAETVIYI